jgi:orotate phosphoribosyltransferase
MQESDILHELTEAKALLKGHFILSSGLHSEAYVQCARALMNPARADRLCRALANKVRHYANEHNTAFDIVVAPAMGGVVIGYEMARQLGIDSMFCERVEGAFQLRRGFEIAENARVLIVEDVVTTGKSTMETAHCIEQCGGKPLAVASLIDRRGTNGNARSQLTLPLISLIALDFPAYPDDAIPDALKNIPAIKPGSRWLKAS